MERSLLVLAAEATSGRKLEAGSWKLGAMESEVLTDDELVAGFEAGSLAEFHHADHVRLTLVISRGTGETPRSGT